MKPMTGAEQLGVGRMLSQRIPDVPGLRRRRVTVMLQVDGKRSSLAMSIPWHADTLAEARWGLDAETEVIGQMSDDLKPALRLALRDLLIQLDGEA